ncbi:LppU/SCO3897 family protein [Klenkia taihuensis]|uniref:LppU/SCO3897 family protein n=1 Tax=Klenkia taihuensis TaxID=1225127 RepID=UPI000B880E22|nr:hypothetical protein [Klenkia taihuensis]GHE08189.1 hypothetical protein GCM10011381_07980 [Klenkia taihuensis]
MTVRTRTLLAAAVVVLAVVGVLLVRGGPSPGVGDCVAAGPDQTVVVVGCDDPAAAFRVIGVLDDVPPVQSQPACTAVFPRSTASYSAGGLSRTPAEVLCLVAA